jgi:hypothetical protein
MLYLVVGIVMAESVVDMTNDGGVTLPAIDPDQQVRELEN